MPFNHKIKQVAEKIPRFTAIFGFEWKLFTPPHNCNNRLYFMVREVARPERVDTIEVLESLALQKQKAAPFNQKENILDKIVNNIIYKLLRSVYEYRKMPTTSSSGTTDSAYITASIAAVDSTKNYKIYLATLYNYARASFKEHGINLTGKECKIVIRQKMMCPFKDRNDMNFLEKEVLVFETPYKLVDR